MPQDSLVLGSSRKAQLDSNIRKMIEGGASNEDVMSYASDFKNQFGEKKNPAENASPIGTQTSNRGFEPFQSQVDTKTPSVLITDEQRQQKEQDRIAKRFETTLLNVPTEFGKIDQFMRSAKKVKDTLPEVPTLNPSGQMTVIPQGEKIGDSLRKGDTLQDLVTDKFTNKKTGLQKQIENAENAFRVYQGEDIASQVQNYIPEEETLKIKQELGFGEKMSNAGSNFVNRLERFAPNTALSVGQTLTTLLGEDYGSDAYRMITNGGNAEFHRMEAFDKLARLDSEYKYSKGLIDSIQDFDLPSLAAGVTDAVGSLVSTVITSAPTMGLGLYSDMVGSGLYDYNSAKANRLGLTVEELYDSGQNEFFVPATLGGIGARLEKIGLKGIKTAIMDGMAKGAGQKLALIAHGMNKEGVTELLQTGLEQSSNALAQGKSGLEATAEFGKTLFSKKGAESYLMGAIASGVAIGGGRILKGMITPKSKAKASEAIQTIEQQQQELANPNLTEESRNFIIENIENNVNMLVSAVDSDIDTVEGLSAEQKREINELNTKIQAFEVVVNDPNVSEQTKKLAQERIDKLDLEVDNILKKPKKPPIDPPATGGAMVEDTVQELSGSIEQRRKEAEAKIKRKDLFSDGGSFANQLGGSGVDSVPTNHTEINGIEFVEFSNPNSGEVDVVMTGTSGNDFVGFYRIYENGKPTNKWSSKFENQSRNKENFKTMIGGVQSMLPKWHEYTETTSISTDGLRIWNQQLGRGYELQYDNNGNLITNSVAINGDAIVNELGIDVDAGNFENISVTTKEQFDNVKKALLPYLNKLGLNESNIKWINGTVEIDLPILRNKSETPTTEQSLIEEAVVEPTQEPNETVGERVIYDREPTADDGVYKILGDENNIIYRVNQNTGRIQEFSDGAWSNTASNAIARGTAKAHGFQKIKYPSITVEKSPTQETPKAEGSNVGRILDLLSKSDAKGVGKIKRRSEVSGISLIDAAKEYLENYPSLSGKGKNRFEELQIQASEKSPTQEAEAEAKKTTVEAEVLDVPKAVKDAGFELAIVQTPSGKFRVVETNSKKPVGKVYDTKADLIEAYNANKDKITVELLQEATGTPPAKTLPVKDEMAGMEEMFAKLSTPPTENQGVSATSKSAIDNLKTNAKDSIKVKVIEAAEKLIKTLKSVFPNMDIFIHDNEGSYNAAMAMSDVMGKADSSGNFSYIKQNDGSITGRIDINLSKANARTVAHEVAHAIMLKAFGENPALFKNFRDRISKVLSNSANKKLMDFADQYEGEESYEEYLVELTAMLSNQKGKISPTILQKIAEAINDIVSRLTQGKFIPFEDVRNAINNASDVLDFLNNIAESIREGEEIGLNDFNMLGVSGVVNASGVAKSKSSISAGEIKRFPTHPNVKVSEDVKLSKFNGKTLNLFESDRMVAGYIPDSEGNPLYKFFGGVFYPIITGKWWASGSSTTANKIANNANKNRESDGYVYSSPMVGSEDQHMSNKDMLFTTIEFMKADVNNKKSKVKIGDVVDSLRKASNRAGVRGRGSVIEYVINNSKDVNELFNNLEYVLFQDGKTVLDNKGKAFLDTDGKPVPNFTFEARKQVVETLLGDPKVKEARFPSAGTATDVAKRFEEPVTSKVERIGDLVTVMRTKGELRTRITDKSDPFYHKSYNHETYAANPDGSLAEIEVFVLDGAYSMGDALPVLIKSSGGEFTWEDYQNRHSKKGQKTVEAQYNRTAKLSSASGKVVSKSQLEKPTFKLQFASPQDLVNTKDPIGNKEKHNDIKERFKKLRQLIDCL